MRQSIRKVIGATALMSGLVLTGCGGASDSTGATAGGGTTGISLTGVVVTTVDSAGKPISNAKISITSKTSGTNVAAGALMTGAAGAEQTTDKDGKITMGDKGSDKHHTVKITCADNTIIIMSLEVDSADKPDDNEAMKIQLPISTDNNTCKKLKAKVTSLSGNVHDTSTGAGLAGVTVTLLSDKIGMLASASTSANGEYTLVANVNQKKVSELKNLTLIFSKDGFVRVEEKIKLKANSIRIGHDVDLTAMTAAEITVATSNRIYGEDFETEAADNAWTKTGLWNVRSNDAVVFNAAYNQGLVDLAPNDSSLGRLPDAAAGNAAMWFGQVMGADNVAGNYMDVGDTTVNTFNALNGGTTYDPLVDVMNGGVITPSAEAMLVLNDAAVAGDPYVAVGLVVGDVYAAAGYIAAANNDPYAALEVVLKVDAAIAAAGGDPYAAIAAAGGDPVAEVQFAGGDPYAALADLLLWQGTGVSGNLTSPVMDLSGVTSPYVSVTFDSWWEIESVNPNTSGYDRLTVQYTIDAGTTWVNLARLNPLADPYTDTVRDAIPYTNNGFNVAPSWLKQENIPLVNPVDGTSLKGQAALQIRFNFDTIDPLFNGFRGWAIDNFKVVESATTPGTFPVMDPYSLFVINDASSSFYDPYASQALAFEWIFPAWNDATGDLNVTPSMFDAASATGLATLKTGVATTITATFDYEASAGTSAKLMYAKDDGAFVAFGNMMPLTAGGLQTITLTGDVFPTTGITAVDVVVQMFDTATGAVIMESPVALYLVQ